MVREPRQCSTESHLLHLLRDRSQIENCFQFEQASPAAPSSGTYWTQVTVRNSTVHDIVQAPALPGFTVVTSTKGSCQVEAAPFFLLQGPKRGTESLRLGKFLPAGPLNSAVRLTFVTFLGSRQWRGVAWKCSKSSLWSPGRAGSVTALLISHRPALPTFTEAVPKAQGCSWQVPSRQGS